MIDVNQGTLDQQMKEDLWIAVSTDDPHLAKSHGGV